MNPKICLQNSFPDDIAFKIVSSLQVSDVCSLGSCSRFWKDLCGSDSVWEALCKHRWPALVVDQVSSANFKGWREVYVTKHAEMARKAVVLVDFLKRGCSYESIESGHYLRTIEEMYSMQFGFQDVEMFFLKPNMNVLLNLVGLHYCFMYLDVPAECVAEALRNNRILERQVRVQWWKLGRWRSGFRLRDEANTRTVSLGDLATAKATEVLSVLHRGVIHEVLRVQICAPKPTCTTW